MPRYYRRSGYSRGYSRPVKTTHWSNETYNAQGAVTLSSTGEQPTKAVTVVPTTTTLGTRKVKNFTVNVSPTDLYNSSTDEVISTSSWLVALVYVPEGGNAHPLNFGSLDTGAATSTYEPNQNVICSGIVTSDQPWRISSRLARNLQSGDTIQLLFRSLDSADNTTTKADLFMTVNYAINY